MEKEIFNSINNKETKYYKPDNIAAINTYKKEPLSVNGIVAAMIYNKLKDDDYPAINLEERNKIIKIKIDINKVNVNLIRETYPEVYSKMINLLNDPLLGSKLKIFALYFLLTHPLIPLKNSAAAIIPSTKPLPKVADRPISKSFSLILKKSLSSFIFTTPAMHIFHA